MYVAALDVGTGGYHAAVYNDRLEVLADTYVEISYSSPHGNAALLEFDPEEFFRRGMEALASAVSEASLPPDCDLTVAVTGQRHGSVFLDSALNPLLGVANLDGRVDRETLHGWSREAPRVYRLAGRVPSEIFPAMRLVWMRREDPQRFSAIHSFLMINEWFCYRMTGNPAAEHSNTTETLLYDITAGSWSDELLEIFGLNHLHRWDLTRPGEVTGTVLPEVARGYRLPQGTKVSLSAADTQCAVVGSHAWDAGDVVVVNGSTTPVVQVCGKAILDPLGRTWVNRYTDELYLLESNAGRSGMVYRSITRALSCQDLPEALPETVLEADRLGVSGTLMPDPDAPVDFLGAPQEIRFLGEPVRVLQLLPYLMLENTAFAIAAAVEEVERTGGVPGARVFLTGGSSRSALTQALLAELLGDRSLYLTGTYDTTARGAAMVAYARVRSPGRLERGLRELPQLPGTRLVPPANLPGFSGTVRNRYARWRQSFAALRRGAELRNGGTGG